MVGKHYLLEKSVKPSGFKLLLDQRIIPFAIDFAGMCEIAVQSISQRSRIRPAVLVAAGAGAGLMIAFALLRRKRSNNI